MNHDLHFVPEGNRTGFEFLLSLRSKTSECGTSADSTCGGASAELAEIDAVEHGQENWRSLRRSGHVSGLGCDACAGVVGAGVLVRRDGIAAVHHIVDRVAGGAVVRAGGTDAGHALYLKPATTHLINPMALSVR